MTVGEYPDGVPESFRIPPEIFASDAPFPRFENIAPELGLAAFNLFGAAVADDFDGDGWIDLFTSTAHTSEKARLYRNNRDGTFADVSDAANLEGINGGLNVVQADYDNDGDVDVLVLRGAWLRAAGRHPKSLLRNDGHGRFADVTFDAGLGERYYPTQTANWADYDNDGDLDLYVGNEEDGRDVTDAPCQLFRNDGNGTFADVAEQAGVTTHAFAKGVTWGDYDGDRFPDLYVSVNGGPNRLYHNNGNGTFTDVAAKPASRCRSTASRPGSGTTTTTARSTSTSPPTAVLPAPWPRWRSATSAARPRSSSDASTRATATAAFATWHPRPGSTASTSPWAPTSATSTTTAGSTSTSAPAIPTTKR